MALRLSSMGLVFANGSTPPRGAAPVKSRIPAMAFFLLCCARSGRLAWQLLSPSPSESRAQFIPHAEEPCLKRVYARLRRAMARRLEAWGAISAPLNTRYGARLVLRAPSLRDAPQDEAPLPALSASTRA